MVDLVGQPGDAARMRGDRSEKRVTARSKLPRNRWTELALPRRAVRRVDTRSTATQARKKRATASASWGRSASVLREGHRAGDLVRSAVELRRRPEAAEGIDEPRVDLRDRPGAEVGPARAPVRGGPGHRMVEEVERDLHPARAIRRGRGREATGVPAKRGVPGVVDPGGPVQPALADDPRVEMRRRAGLAPRLAGEVRPGDRRVRLSTSPPPGRQRTIARRRSPPQGAPRATGSGDGQANACGARPGTRRPGS